MQSWIDLRHELAKDRRALIKFVMAAGAYEPLAHLVKAHVVSPSSRDRIAHKLMLGGIGGGKTHWAMAEMVACVVANPGGWFLVSAPTYDQAVNVLRPHWERFADAFEASGHPIQKRWDNQQQCSDLVGGGRMFLRTYSKVGNLLGFEFTAALLDEIDTIPRPMQVWDAIKGRVRRPGANWRQMFASSTPRGLQGVTELFHRNREEAKASGNVEHLRAWYWTRALGRDNPHLPTDYLPSLRAAYSQRQWRQEVEAEILQPESTVWPEFGRETHAQTWTPGPNMTWDLSYDAGDQFPHVLWIQRTPWCDIIFDELCPDGWSIDKLHTEILARSSRLRSPPEFAIGDRAVKSELSWMMDAFPKTTVRRMHTRHDQSINEGIELVRARLDPLDGPPRLMVAAHLFNQPPRRGIVRCLSQYRYKMRADGGMTNEPWKDNVFDHGCDAVRYHQVALHGTEFAAFNVGRTH